MTERTFDYFLYDNMDADAVPARDNPRAVLNAGADAALLDVLNAAPFACGYAALCARHGAARADDLTAAVRGVGNGFDAKTNLYHLLCGAGDSRGASFRSRVLDAFARLVETGRCEDAYLRLFEAFGYAVGGKVAVPVYRGGAKDAVARLTGVVVDAIGEDVAALLGASPALDAFVCRKHGVPRAEVANEVWHMLFGLVNEGLVERGIVATPERRAGEGRYLRSAEV